MIKLNIWLIQTGEILPLKNSSKKMRTALLADKLTEREHDVLWWTSAFDHFKKDWIFNRDSIINLNEKYKIYALKGVGYKKNISLSRYIDHRIIAWKFRKSVSKMPKPDVIVTSMPPHDLAYEAVRFGNQNNIPVVVDVRDEWPDIFLKFIPNSLHIISKLLLVKDFQMIKYVCSKASSLVSVMESLLRWSLFKGNRQRSEFDKIFYLGAKKIEPTTIKEVKKLAYLKESIENKFVVTFIGTFGKFNNPLILVDVAKKLSNASIYFIVGGNGTYFDQIKNAVRSLKNITLTDWLTEEEISYVLSISHVGIITCDERGEAFPNKAFTYTSAGLPLISSLQGELKYIIEKYRIGFYYPPNDVNALTDCILKLYNDSLLYKQMSQNTQKVFAEMFDADKIYTEYAEHVERVVLNKKEGKIP